MGLDGVGWAPSQTPFNPIFESLSRTKNQKYTNVTPCRSSILHRSNADKYMNTMVWYRESSWSDIHHAVTPNPAVRRSNPIFHLDGRVVLCKTISQSEDGQSATQQHTKHHRHTPVVEFESFLSFCAPRCRGLVDTNPVCISCMSNSAGNWNTMQ